LRRTLGVDLDPMGLVGGQILDVEDCIHGARSQTCAARNAFDGVNVNHPLVLVKTGYRANRDTFSEAAIQAVISNNDGH
jgi:hypothetical protein